MTAMDNSFVLLGFNASLSVVVLFGFTAEVHIQTTSITEPEESGWVVRHVCQYIIIWKRLKIHIANRALKSLPETSEQILLAFALVVPEMFLLLFLVQGSPAKITEWAFAGFAESILMTFQMFGYLFSFVFRKSNSTHLAS
jgi:hypothetical protein